MTQFLITCKAFAPCPVNAEGKEHHGTRLILSCIISNGFLKAKREEAEKEAAAIVLKAKVQADKSRQEAERYWDNLSIRLEAFYREHKGLQELLNSTGGIRK